MQFVTRTQLQFILRFTTTMYLKWVFCRLLLKYNDDNNNNNNNNNNNSLY